MITSDRVRRTGYIHGIFRLKDNCRLNNAYFQVFSNHKPLPLGFPLNSNKAMSGGAMIVNFVHTVKEKLNEALDVSETSGIIAEVRITDFSNHTRPQCL